MAVRADRFTRTEQVIWIAIACALCVVEVYAIGKDRDDHDKTESDIREMDRITRGVERRSFQKLIDSGRGLLSQEQRTSTFVEQNLESMTGAGSFPVVDPLLNPDGTVMYTNGKPGVPLALSVVGKHDMIDVNIQILSHMGPQLKVERLTEELFHPLSVTIPLALANINTLFGLPIRLDEPLGDHDQYDVIITARNGRFIENMSTAGVKERAVFSYTVRGTVNGKPKLLYEYPPKPVIRPPR